MRLGYFRGGALVALAAAPAFVIAPPVKAQDSAQLSEIIVTARKRQESILNVPVVETAIPQQQLQRFQVQDLRDLSKLVPGLVLGQSILSVGVQPSIRGVTTSSLDPGVDNSVALVVDGLQLSQGLAYASAMFDVGQVEVLKGPQSLFYGKTSPGGVISLRTADPTDKFEMIARLGYEAEANERRGEFIISGPVTDTLKLRLAAAADKQDGFYTNLGTGIPALGGFTGTRSISPSKSYMIRLTALWNPTSKFDARLKLNQVRDRSEYTPVRQLVYCPDGVGAFNGVNWLNPREDCTADRYTSTVGMSPAAFPGIIHDGVPYTDATQTYGSLEMNYRMTPQLELTSSTGYYLVHNRALFNATQTGAAGPLFDAVNGFHRREVTEEVRLNSDFSGPLNFTAGAYVERGRFDDLVLIGGNTFVGLPAIVQKGQKIVDIRTNSVFGQLRYKIMPRLELAAGAR
jgi:iron complex outermembrane receptor protein